MPRAAFPNLPPLYPILDGDSLHRAGISLQPFARELHAAGLRFFQYRDKDAGDDEFLNHARLLRELLPAPENILILNDRVHLLHDSGCDGVHVGQQDLHPNHARAAIAPDHLLGVSTHNAAQLRAAASAPVDYIAIGPVFSTHSKTNPDPVVGLTGVRQARSLTRKPLVAIGGITPANARAVLDAGADSIALISALLPSQGRSTAQLLEDFLSRIG